MKKDRIRKVLFTPRPQGGHRFVYNNDKYIILDSKRAITLADDKKTYPSKFENQFNVKIITNEITFEFEVFKGYRWNNADIFGVIQIFAMCSKDDRRIILPSGIHDYMLEYKPQIFSNIKKKYPDYTIAKYRHITSETFKYLCKMQGFTGVKANVMGNCVDFFQKYFQRKKWKIENTESQTID